MSKPKSQITRRQALVAAGAAASIVAMPNIVRAADAKLKIGALLPLTGDLALWGVPGKVGAEVWAARTNKAGGITISGTRHEVDIVSFDGAYVAEKTIQGARSFVDQAVAYTMVIGGDDWSALQDFSNRNKLLTSTLYVTDLNPDAKYLLAPVEVHPLYFGCGAEYLRKVEPDVKTVALCAQDDLTGRVALAYWRAGFDAHDFEIVKDEYFDAATTDFAPVVSSLLASKPQAVCLDTAYPSFALLLVEQLYLQGFKGRILHAGLELLPDMVKRTSVEFMEGAITFFPRFDDPNIGKFAPGFPDPAGFYADVEKTSPGGWNNTTWEFAACCEVWKRAVETANTTEPDALLASMRANPPTHIYGPATWWGQDLFGINNALVGSWPIVEVKSGKVDIVELGDQAAWYEKHKDLVVKRFREENLMPDQKK